jgi:hypothetical protein
VFDGAPGATAADQFGLEQPDHGFGQRVIQRVADRADRCIDPGFGEAFGERNRDIPRVEFVKRRLPLGWN